MTEQEVQWGEWRDAPGGIRRRSRSILPGSVWPAEQYADASYLNALEREVRDLRAKAALADEAKALMDGWRTPFVIGDGSMDAEAEYERGTRRLVTATREWLTRYDSLPSTSEGEGHERG